MTFDIYPSEQEIALRETHQTLLRARAELIVQLAAIDLALSQPLEEFHDRTMTLSTTSDS